MCTAAAHAGLCKERRQCAQGALQGWGWKHLGRVCQDQLCSKGLQQDPPFQGHGRGHCQNQLVALGSSHKGKTNASVARRGLNKSGHPCKQKCKLEDFLQHSASEVAVSLCE